MGTGEPHLLHFLLDQPPPVIHVPLSLLERKPWELVLANVVPILLPLLIPVLPKTSLSSLGLFPLPPIPSPSISPRYKRPPLLLHLLRHHPRQRHSLLIQILLIRPILGLH